MQSLSEVQVNGLKRWLLNRQIDGFQGRPNKPVDTCYSFWIGATLKMLGCYNLVNYEMNRGYVLSTQNEITGGLAKWTSNVPDPLHTYLGLAGLSLMKENKLIDVAPSLNITKRALMHLHLIQSQWS